MLHKSDYLYHLPQHLIAQTPAEPRDSAKLLCYNRKTDIVTDKFFYECPSLLQEGDLLVVNTTKVIPARIYARTAHDAKIEILLLTRINNTTWEVLVKPGKKVQIGSTLYISDALSATVLEKTAFGGRILEFSFQGIFEEILDTVGNMPLPPYIHQKLQDANRYQTVYCKEAGSVAAPTAGLHFTKNLLNTLKKKGVTLAEVQLNVGLGTFRPVKEEDITKHKMHIEKYSLDAKNAMQINLAKKEHRRIIAVGTTTVRVLETIADSNGYVQPQQGETDIFIYPPYQFKCVDALFTNFHLPESTLLMLVSAFIGREKTLQLYQYAVEKEYRFFSFGDAMCIL